MYTSTRRTERKAFARRRPRILYFDVDGTLVRRTFEGAKPALACGRFEALVRAARFDRIVCVSDAILIGDLVAKTLRGGRDARDTIFRLCRGTIADEGWFRSAVELVPDPMRRCSYIDRRADWYYADDCADGYAALADLDAFACGRRILPCDPEGDGSDVARWLSELAVRRADARRPYSASGPRSRLTAP